MTDLRALGVARISNLTDESTSMPRQTEQIDYTVKGRGDTLIHIAEDTDVSGSVSPFDRDGLGPWLTDPKLICQWDYLIFTKLDRLTRSLGDFDDLVNWCDRNGKTLVSISESIDLSTYIGRMLANILAMFAQFERERMADRAKDSHAKSRANGWWHGGNPPYGYRAVKVENHYELRADDDEISVIRSIVADFIAGNSRAAIVRNLNEKGILSPYGKKWARIGVKRVLESASPFVTEDDFSKVQDMLDDTSNPVTLRTNTTMLLNVGYCVCGSPLYSSVTNHKSRKCIDSYNRTASVYEYYRCYRNCGVRMIPMAKLDAAASDAVVDAFGWVEVWTKTTTRGSDHTKEIAAIERAIRQLDLDAEGADEQWAALTSERKRLKALPVGDDYIDYAPTGMTVAEYWPTLSPAQRRAFLVQNEVRVTGRREQSGDVSVVVGPHPVTLGGAEFFTAVAALADAS